jgi:hypothetical protein
MTAARPPEDTIAGTAVVSEAEEGTLAYDMLGADDARPAVALRFPEEDTGAADSAEGGRPGEHGSGAPSSHGSQQEAGEAEADAGSDSEWRSCAGGLAGQEEAAWG